MPSAAQRDTAGAAGQPAMKNLPARRPRTPPPATPKSLELEDPVLRLIDKALDLNQGMETVQALKELVALKVGQEERDAKKEFIVALGLFQQDCPEVVKSKVAKITSREGGTKFQYRYAELPAIQRAVKGPLSKHGLSYSWTGKVTPQSVVKVCHLRHVNGHEETAECEVVIAQDTGMSGAQKMSAASTVARRQSLIDVLGIASADPDTDGAEQESVQAPRITQEQADDVRALAEEVKADKAALLRWVGVERFEDIPESKVKTVTRELERRRGGVPRAQPGGAGPDGPKGA